MKFQSLIKKIAETFDKNNIPYIIIGGQALLIHGEPRLTKDIDITLGITPESLPRIIEILNDLSLKVLVDNPEKFVEETWVLPAICPVSKIRVDFIFSNSEFEKNVLKRAINVKIENYPVKFTTVEDLIIYKIIAGRERDIEDVKNLIIKNSLDIEYIEKWLERFEIIFNKDFRKLFKVLLQS